MALFYQKIRSAAGNQNCKLQEYCKRTVKRVWSIVGIMEDGACPLQHVCNTLGLAQRTCAGLTGLGLCPQGTIQGHPSADTPCGVAKVP